jgi:hypothetical protein
MADRDVPMTEQQARQLAQDYRLEFKNSEAFEAAWTALYELKSAISLPLARRIMSEELLKFRTRQAGLEAAAYLAGTAVPVPPPPEPPFKCPVCQREMRQWQRDGHAAGCAHDGFYALEVRCRIAIERSRAARERRREEERRRAALPDPPVLEPTPEEVPV